VRTEATFHCHGFGDVAQRIAVQVALLTPQELSRQLGDAAPDPAGRADYMAALTIRTASLAQAARVLQAGGISRARVEPQRILVPAADAMNVALEFVE